MSHDDSVASQVEDWICEQIRGIKIDDVAVFEETEVQPWNGTHAGNPNAIAQELFSGDRDLVARVFYHSDHVMRLEEGDIRVVPRYVVLIGIQNRRPAAARRGDGSTIGTNRLRDLLKGALHGKQPTNDQSQAISDGATAVDMTHFRGSRLLVNMENLCIQETVIEVDESEKA